MGIGRGLFSTVTCRQAFERNDSARPARPGSNSTTERPRPGHERANRAWLRVSGWPRCRRDWASILRWEYGGTAGVRKSEPTPATVGPIGAALAFEAGSLSE